MGTINENNPVMTPEERAELARRYERALHKMQTGVAYFLQCGDPSKAAECAPKHLRVGVNSALVDSSALARLLMNKGIITEKEYMVAIAEGMEAEANTYEREVRKILNNGNIKLS